jgi:purine-cytosine permease-like protein
MPRGRAKSKGFGLGDAFMIAAAVLFVWLVLKSLHFVDPPEDFTTYILEAIIGVMITAWFTESRDFRNRTIKQGEDIVEIKTKINYLEKGFEELRTKLSY